MNKRILLLTLIGISFGINAQNTFPTTGKVGIGISTPQYTIDIDGNFQRGSGIKHIMRLTHKNALDSGDGTSLLFTNRGHSSNDYGGYIALVSSGSNPGWLNPRLDFAVQNPNTHQLNDISTKMTILGNGNVGIGTITATEVLDVQGNIRANRMIKIDGHGSVASLQIMDNSNTGSLDVLLRGDGGSSYIKSGNIGIGTTNPDMKLTVNGNIHAKEVKIDLNIPAPDYVFKENYNLRSIEEVESFIKENSHLPEIPSAKEFEQNGVMQAEMDMNLLKKIEELTLYTIQQQKEIEELKLQNKKLLELQKRLEKLEQK